jgi:hypothetical protein
MVVRPQPYFPTLIFTAFSPELSDLGVTVSLERLALEQAVLPVALAREAEL